MTMISTRPSLGSAPGSTRKPNPKSGRFDTNSCAPRAVVSSPASPRTRNVYGVYLRSAPPDANRVGRVSGERPRGRACALAEVARVVAGVAVTRRGLEPAAHGLDGIDAAAWRLYAKRVDGPCRRPRCDAEGVTAAHRDAEPAGHVVGAPGWDERDLREPLQRSVRRVVHRPVASYQDRTPPGRSRGSQRVEQVVPREGDQRPGAGPELFEPLDELIGRVPRVRHAAGPRVDDEQERRFAARVDAFEHLRSPRSA